MIGQALALLVLAVVIALLFRAVERPAPRRRYGRRARNARPGYLEVRNK